MKLIFDQDGIRLVHKFLVKIFLRFPTGGGGGSRTPYPPKSASDVWSRQKVYLTRNVVEYRQ